MRDYFDTLLNKEMSRQEFIRYMGLGLLTFLGLGTILPHLLGKTNQNKLSNSNTYGGSTYGDRTDG